MTLYTRTAIRNIIVLLVVLLGLMPSAQSADGTCSPAQVTAQLTQTSPYTPTADDPEFVTLAGDLFTLADDTFTLRGVNYYPANYPWRRFLTETDEATLQHDFALLQRTGFNSVRIFLWNEALFDCEAHGAVPNPAAFARLDAVMRQAAAHDLYLIVTLNDLPVLEGDAALYNNPSHIIEQTAFIVQRYRDEPAILAWDLRNEGDIDYDGVNLFKPGTVSQEAVISWLAATSRQVRELDTNHLITAGWRYNEQHTAPYVDFISFHHWRGAANLRERLNRMDYDSPILLQEFGFTTFDVTQEQQAAAVRDVVRLIEEERGDVLGWMVWTAFDFPLTATCYPGTCQSLDNREHHFGLWHSDGTPKPAIDVLTAELERLTVP